MKREDAGKELFKIYLNTKPSAIKDFSGDSAKVEYSFYFVKLEMLLAQEDILAKLDSMELTTLANEASKKFSEKLITSEFSGFSISPSILILARILEKNKQLPLRTSPELLGSLKQFSQTGTADNLEFLNQVDSLQAKLK